MKKHFVTFYSPGSFVHETNSESIDSWGTEKATEMARSITQRHSATPFGFRFTTRGRSPDELDSKVTDTSCMYYLGGEVETIEDVRRRNDPSERILLSNMEGNKWNRIIINTNSWKITQPLHDDDVVLEFEP